MIKKSTVVTRLQGAKINWTPLMFLLIAVFLLVHTAMLFFQTSVVMALARRPDELMVQLRDGSSIIAQPLNYYERANEDIDRFVRQMLELLYTWTGKTLDSEGKEIDDRGYSYAPGIVVPESSWIASFAVTPGYRHTLMQDIAKTVPPGVFSGNNQSILQIEHVGSPQKLAPGRWELDVVATTVAFTNGKMIAIQPFNRTVKVNAIPPRVRPFPRTQMEEYAWRLRNAGLEIELLVPTS